MFVRSNDTAVLVSVLSEVTEPDSIVTYDQLSRSLGRPVDGSTSALQSAKRICLKEKGQVWLVVRNEGVRLARDNELAGFHRIHSTRRIRHVASKAVKQMDTIDLEQLTDAERLELGVSRSFFEFQREAARERSFKRLESIKPQEQLPFNQFLEAIKNT